MADTPLVKKLGIKPGYRLLVLNAPEGYLEAFNPLPEGAAVQAEGAGSYDCVLVFVANQAVLGADLPRALAALKPGGLLWFAYPKKSSKVKTDITRDSGWDTVRQAGLEGVAMVSIDDIWSAMRFRPLAEIKQMTRKTE